MRIVKKQACGGSTLIELAVFQCPSNPSRRKDDYNTCTGYQPPGIPIFPASYAANRGNGSSGPFVDEPIPAGTAPSSSRDATSMVSLAMIDAQCRSSPPL